MTDNDLRRALPVIVFDLGGTWWRSAALSADGVLADVHQHHAITKARTGSNPATLRELMVRFLITRTRELRVRHPEAGSVGVSIGAATNGHTGLVLASAPLWGDCTDPFDLRAALVAGEPDLQWWVVNDVTALALAISNIGRVRERGLRTIAVVTVSSGIAARTIDVASGMVPVDRRYGIQGEIGHLPALSTMPETNPPVCDCGVVGHISATASGKAIEQHLARLTWIVDGDRGDEVEPVHLLERLRRSLDANSAAATDFIDGVTAPLARALLYLMTIDARVEHVFLSGGVVTILQGHYMDSLYRNLEADGLYLASTYQPSIFRDRISRVESDGFDSLRGAGVFARESSRGYLQAADRER